MKHSFVFFKEIITEYVPGEDALCLGKKEMKKLNGFLDDLRPDVMMVVISDEPVEGKDHMAYVKEHYNVGIMDASRVLVRREFAALMRRKETEGEFALLCRMYATADKFAVFQREEKELSLPSNSYRLWKDMGEYPVAVVGYKKIWKQLQKKYGEVPAFFQHLVIQNMFHAGFTQKEAMSDKLKEDFIHILSEIEDDVICICQGIPDDVKIWLLEAKYGKDIKGELVYRSGRLRYHNLTITSLKEIPYYVTELAYQEKKLVVRGEVIYPVAGDDIWYYAMDNRNKEIPLSVETKEDVFYLGEKKKTRKNFCAEIPLGNKPVGFRFMYRYHNLYRARVRMAFAKELKMVPDTKDNYVFFEHYMLRTEKRILFAAPLQKKTRIKQFFTFGRKSIKMDNRTDK